MPCLSLLLDNKLLQSMLCDMFGTEFFCLKKTGNTGERTVFQFHYLIRRGIDSLQSLLFVHRYILYYDLLSRIDKKS